MDTATTVAEILRLPAHCCRRLSPDRVVCIVTEEWVKQLYQGHIQSAQTDLNFCAFTAEKYLAHSCPSPPAPWTRLTAKIWPKSLPGLQNLLDSGLSAHIIGDSLVELMANVSRDNLHNLWQATQSKFIYAYPLSHHQGHHQAHHGSAYSCRPQESLSDQMWHWIWRLSPDIHIQVGDVSGHRRKDETFVSSQTSGTNLHSLLQHSKIRHPHSDDDEHTLHNVTHVRVLVETESNFLLLQPYVEYSLRDVLSYSPAVMDTCYSKPLFILYQVLQAMATMHGRGLPLGSVSLDTVLLDSNMWVSVLCPQKRAFTSPALSLASAQQGTKQSAAVDRTGVQSSSNREGSRPSSGVLPETNPSHSVAASQAVTLSAYRQESKTRAGSLPGSALISRQLTSGYTDEDEQLYLEGCQFLQQQGYMALAQCSLTDLVNDWVERRLSNFQYLLILNHLAGRHMNDPNNHPVLPWVMDFSHPHDGFRDLTKSKFRLNKGDRQLDFTFGLESSYTNTGSDNQDSDTIPHHVSDVLSDITYYVYKARRMPKSILCSHVRTVWVPHEYPASMQRMQGWTPDECIPEFFTDPQIFQSIHSDLPDLEIPNWCSSTREFVIRHMAVLESERVSEQLHHWVDLTFGCKLSGKAAVQAKNVYLQLVDGHQTLRSHGIMQLFTQPHPHRLLLSSRPQLGSLRGLRDINVRRHDEEAQQEQVTFELSYDNISTQNVPPESATIFLPINYDPLTELEQCEAMQGFKAKTLLQLQEEKASAAQQMIQKTRQHAFVTQDMASFLCLVCEIFLAPKLRMQQDSLSLYQRLQNIRVLCAGDISMIPRPFQKAVRLLLTDLHVEPALDSGQEGAENYKVHFSPVMMGGLPPPTPSLWLHPQADVLPFPAFFPHLYRCLCRLKATDEAMLEVKRGTESSAEKAAMLKQLARSKVPVMEQFLHRWGGDLGKEGLQLVLPLVDSLLADKLTMVQAAWQLFNILSRALGPTRTRQTFLPALSVLLSDSPATAKHIKLYHRTYLIQLLLRLHLQPFLHHFATLLVEAVAGYKDFLLPSQFYSQELLDDLDTAEQDTQWIMADNTPASRVVLAEEVREDGDQAGAGSDVERATDDEDREEFLDALSLGDETDGVGDAADDPGREERDSIGGVSQSSEAGENGEDGVFDSDRCSIHSISNILCRSGVRSSTTGEEDDDKVFDSPRGSEGGMSKPASASSLGLLAGESPTHSVDASTGLLEQPAGRGYGSSQPARTIPDQSDSTQVQREKPSKPLYIGISQTVPTIKATEAESDTEDLKTSDDYDDSDGLSQSKVKTSDNMKRSETEDLMSTLSLNSPTSAVNIRHIAADSVKWLVTKLGPVLAARYLSRNLVRMLPLCYLGETQLRSIDSTEMAVVKTSRCVIGDGNASKVLECIGFVACLYGENIILIQYLPSIVDMINVAQRRFTQRSESGLVAAVILLRFVVPLLSDKTLMDVLEDTIVTECVTPVLNLLTSTSVSFPSGAFCRYLLCHKLVDLLYVLGLRLGLEMTRRFLHNPMLVLMEAFSTVHAPDQTSFTVSTSPVVGSNSDESYLTIKKDLATNQYMIGSPVSLSTLNNLPTGSSLSPGMNMSGLHSLAAIGTVDEREECLSPRPSQDTTEKCLRELASVFTPELALAAYIPLCRIFGSIHMEESLKNDDLIRQLCAQQDSAMDQPAPTAGPDSAITASEESTLSKDSSSSTTVIGGLGSNVEVVGNRIQLSSIQSDRPPSPSPSFTQFGRGYRHDGILQISAEEVRSQEMDANKRRHLRGNWLQYWEHELGLHERDTLFNFKQIKLQSFVGHTNSIRCIVPMDTENCFISASKDKTVRLWPLTSCGDGSSKVPCQWTYQHHKKSVFSVAYVESMRQVASCDSTVHVWDPYTGVSLCQLESTRYSPAVALQSIPAPSPLVLMGTTEATLRFLDLRTYKYGHEFRCSAGSLGLLRCVGVCPEGTWVAVGFSTGVISILELSSGLLLSSWKAHDGEILQLKAYSRHKLVSSSFDGTLKVWSVEGGNEICHLKGPSDPVHCFGFYRDQLLSATAANKIGVHSSVGENAMFTSVKLRSDTFRGVLTSMAVLPLNRTLLLGSDNGNIQLLA